MASEVREDLADHQRGPGGNRLGPLDLAGSATATFTTAGCTFATMSEKPLLKASGDGGRCRLWRKNGHEPRENQDRETEDKILLATHV